MKDVNDYIFEALDAETLELCTNLRQMRAHSGRWYSASHQGRKILSEFENKFLKIPASA